MSVGREQAKKMYKDGMATLTAPFSSLTLNKTRVQGPEVFSSQGQLLKQKTE